MQRNVQRKMRCIYENATIVVNDSALIIFKRSNTNVQILIRNSTNENGKNDNQLASVLDQSPKTKRRLTILKRNFKNNVRKCKMKDYQKVLKKTRKAKVKRNINSS